MAGPSSSSAFFPSSSKSEDIARVFTKEDVEKALGPKETREISYEMRSVVWVIQITAPGNNGKNFIFSRGTGFCVHKDDYIFTAANIFRENLIEIKIRKIDDVYFRSSNDGHVRLVKKIDHLNITLLKVEISRERDEKGFSYASFGDPELFVGQEVIAFSHPHRWVYTTVSGEIAYPCVNDVKREKNSQVIKDVNLQEEILNVGWFDTPTYRKARDVVTQETVANYLHTDVPLVQINNLHGSLGSSGGPIFNSNGHVVGMLIFFSGRADFAVHVSALKEFYDNYVENDRKKSREKERNKRGKEKRWRSTRR